MKNHSCFQSRSGTREKDPKRQDDFTENEGEQYKKQFDKGDVDPSGIEVRVDTSNSRRVR